MALPGLLVEYFITGGFAMIWISLACRGAGIAPPPVSEQWLLLLLPAVYVLGMAVDNIAMLISKPLRVPIYRWARRRGWHGRDFDQRKYSVWDWLLGEQATFSDLAETSLQSSPMLIFNSAELGKEYVMRSSRDRIARGTIVNVLMLTVTLLYYPTTVVSWRPDDIHTFQRCVGVLGVSLTGFSCWMWFRFENATWQFKQHALAVIKQSQNLNALLTGP